MFININPEKDKPEGSYFGIVVTDGYDWHQCYSWAWEVANFWSGNRSVYECFPDIDWSDMSEEAGVMHQCIAIAEKLTDMPKKRFFEKKIVVEA